MRVRFRVRTLWALKGQVMATHRTNTIDRVVWIEHKKINMYRKYPAIIAAKGHWLKGVPTSPALNNDAHTPVSVIARHFMRKVEGLNADGWPL